VEKNLIFSVNSQHFAPKKPFRMTNFRCGAWHSRVKPREEEPFLESDPLNAARAV
jgi:hypothetical protein